MIWMKGKRAAREYPARGTARKFRKNELQEFVVVDNQHPITAGLTLDQPFHYGMYSHLAQAGVGRVLLRSGEYDQLVVHPRGGGVCVYSGMLLGGLNVSMNAPREVKQLLSNLISFLVGVPPRLFRTDPAGPEAAMVEGDLRVAGQSTWLAGVNLHLPDNRGIDLMFDLQHPAWQKLRAELAPEDPDGTLPRPAKLPFRF